MHNHHTKEAYTSRWNRDGSHHYALSDVKNRTVYFSSSSVASDSGIALLSTCPQCILYKGGIATP